MYNLAMTELKSYTWLSLSFMIGPKLATIFNKISGGLIKNNF